MANANENFGSDNLRNEALKAKHTLTDAAYKMGDKVQKLYSNASDEINHISSTVTSEVRKNPVQSSVLALGIGYIFGRFLSR